MSDDGDDFMQDSEEEYDFEFEDDGDDEAGDVGIENKYYNAKQIKVDDPAEAIQEFLQIPAMEEEKGDWGFKGLKQAIKLEYTIGSYADAIAHYVELLTYLSVVTRNYAEKSINNMLDFIEKGAQDSPSARDCMSQFYDNTLTSFERTSNERLWLKTNIKLAKLYLDQQDYVQLSQKIKDMHAVCRKPDGTEDTTKGTQLLEIYAMEIQMYTATKKNKQLKSVYQQALHVTSAVPHPKIQGIIRECGGKMHMSEENWPEAQSAFFEAFKSYDEAGSIQRITVLKYLVLTTMLMKSDINPFESQETKPYKDDARISPLTNLVDAYQHNNITRYEQILSQNPDLLEDVFIAENIDEITRDMRTKAVERIIAPYTRFRLSTVAKALGIPVAEVQDILGFLIVDGKVNGKIDQQAGTMEVQNTRDAQRIAALHTWTKSVDTLAHSVFTDGDGFRAVDFSGASLSLEEQQSHGSHEDSSGMGNRMLGLSDRGDGMDARGKVRRAARQLKV